MRFYPLDAPPVDITDDGEVPVRRPPEPESPRLPCRGVTEGQEDPCHGESAIAPLDDRQSILPARPSDSAKG